MGDTQYAMNTPIVQQETSTYYPPGTVPPNAYGQQQQGPYYPTTSATTYTTSTYTPYNPGAPPAYAPESSSAGYAYPPPQYSDAQQPYKS